ncbi:hypothetical protein PHLCEN_2v13702 [Hermanssonia centrifuga]|uniref:Cytochrome P450 n=1 Tax=Hermanssonia centrifuga TaxID=98765 RepID=A0A2R6NDQ1_9APHY|nr:hypothetical protein PHLCEN_2v13702 [Hermanssonia centrifuga]
MVSSGHPGFRTLFSTFGALHGILFRYPVPGVSIGSFRNWYRKHADFEDFGVDIVSHVSVFPHVTTHLHVADPATMKEITSNRLRFLKPVEQYGALSFFGHNIVASEGEEWKRYRKVTAPAFSEPNNKLVWDETVRIMNGLFDDVWAGKDTIVSDHVVEFTLPIALFVIGAAGFGRRISWQDDLVVPPGHKMTFKDALHVASTDVIIKLICSDWVLKNAPFKRLNKCKAAYDELEQYMLEMIASRRTEEKKEERYDLFSSMLDASADDLDGGAKMTDGELLG